MSYRQRIHRETLKEIDLNRSKADKLLQERTNQIYDKLPEIKAIDNKIKLLGMNVLKKALNSSENTDTCILEIKSSIENLKVKKEDILKKNNIEKNYLTDIYTCSLCEDMGYIKEKKCICLKQKLIEKYYDMSNLKKVLKEENFDTFNFDYYSKEKDKENKPPYENIMLVYRTCLRYIKDFDEKYTNLLFYGNTGLGKTFLCNCIAKDLLDKGKSVIYLTSPSLSKKIENIRFNKNSDEEYVYEEIEMLYECDVLIIDDLGSEISTIVTNSELFNLINVRILERKSTIISSNLSLKDLQVIYSDRISSRLHGNFKMINLYGDDIRLKKKFQTKLTLEV